MLDKTMHAPRTAAGWTLLTVALPLPWWLSHPGRQLLVDPMTLLFWHTAMELFAVVLAMLVFVAGYRTILSARNGALVLLGLAFLGVGLLDFLHALSHVGVPDAVAADTSPPSMAFGLAARLLAALSLLLYIARPTAPDVGTRGARLALIVVLAVVAVLGHVGLRWPDRLPALFVQGHGVTSLKIGLEWLVIGIHLMTLGVLWCRRAAWARDCAMALAFTVALLSVSALFLGSPGRMDPEGASVMGHLYKVAAYLYLFHATFNEALRRPLARMEAQQLRERLVLKDAPDGVLWVDQQGQILLANPAMEALSGYPAHELVGHNVDIFLPAHLRARHALSMRAYFTAPHPGAMGAMDLELRRRDGQMLPVHISLGHWDDEGARHAIAYVRDLSERKKFEESLRYQAAHDELTGLPNRWLFRLQLSHATARAGRSGLRVAVLFLDLDYFKTINDSFGHAAGDALLVQVGERMRGVLRDNDTLARLGGDEFAILLTDLTIVDEAVCVATKLLAALQASYRLDNQEVYSGGSLGLAFYPDDAADSDTLLRYADLAMYQAKQAGRGAYACYSRDMDRKVHEDVQLHTRLKEAIAQGLLQLHYQPQVGVESGLIVGAEALLRWHDAVLGPVSPARFIPVAEATGLILPLSDWVLETACAQIATWMRAGTPLRVAINVSAQQFRQRDLPEQVRAALARTGAQAEWLDLEITESVAMTQPGQAREQLNALVGLGCRVALDDFGTGYSSLAYLKDLPVSKLKIDKSFMDGIPHDANDLTISRAIIALAHNLGMTLVAEGVETEAQLTFLYQNNCEIYQGWLFAKAMPAEELTKLLPSPGDVSRTLKRNDAWSSRPVLVEP
jgi:diguanylate cyclase (GGDEF)-like protein/PAS domain S-box-containing protein